MAENGETDAMDQQIKEEVVEEIKTESSSEEEHTEDYQKLIDYGINAKVANELDKIYKSGESISPTRTRKCVDVSLN